MTFQRKGWVSEREDGRGLRKSSLRVERIGSLGSSGEKNAKPHATRRALRALLSTGPGGLITSVPKSSVSDTEGHHGLRVKGGVVSGNSEQKNLECSFRDGAAGDR